MFNFTFSPMCVKWVVKKETVQQGRKVLVAMFLLKVFPMCNVLFAKRMLYWEDLIGWSNFGR